VFEAF
jgi:hypothetical protein